MKKTKIVATIGPASDSRETLEELIKAGMNVVRLNFSHGDYDSHEKIIRNVRELSKELGMPVGIMADLQGPRIRIKVDREIEINKGEHIWVSDISSRSNFSAQGGPASGGQFPISNFQTIFNDQNSKDKHIMLDWKGIVGNIDKGNDILIEDGLMRVKVVEKDDGWLLAKVMEGGVVKNHKGVNIPDAKFSFGALTEKDERDLEFVLRQEVDFVALSFVSNGKEIEEAREKIKKIIGRDDALPQIVSKIERKEAIKNIDEVIKASDVVMVARGDLGIELPESKVVIYQKQIIAKCLTAVKPVIVATQMLDSMIRNPIPTRAEVSDVSNAVIDHTDAVMLSGESANGKYPAKAVEVMSEIIVNTEESPFDDINREDMDPAILTDHVSVIDSAHELAKSSKSRAILMITESGLTARIISHHRPNQLLLAATSTPKTYYQLSMVWGVEPYLFANGHKRDDFFDLLIEKAKKEGKLSSEDKVVIIKGKTPTGEKTKWVGIREV